MMTAIVGLVGGVPPLGNAQTAPPATTVTVQNSALIARLKRAPISVSASSQTIVLKPFVWRDFMPIAPVDGAPMIAILRFVPADSVPLAARIAVESAWVINRALVWAQRVTEIVPPHLRPAGHEVAIRDGPKWGPGVAVDVIARIRVNGGRPILLRASNVVIQRTD